MTSNDLYADIKAQLRAVYAGGKRHSTRTVNGTPIEACWILVAGPADRPSIENLKGANGGSVFLSCDQYPTRRRLLKGEIGYLLGHGVNVLIDEGHQGPPTIYADGERAVELADDLVTWAGALERCTQAIREASELFARRRRDTAWDEMRRAQDSFNRAVELLTAEEAAEAKLEAERAAFDVERRAGA